MKRITPFLIFALVLSAINYVNSQIAETFTKSWEGSIAGQVNAVEADPRNSEAFYVAFEVRKFATEEDNFTYLAKLDCEGNVEWRIGVETLGDLDEFVDMAVLSDGTIGILQRSSANVMQLNWISRSNRTVRTSLEITLDENTTPWRLLPHPNSSNFMIIMGYDVAGTDQLAFLEVDEGGNQLLSVTAGSYDSSVEGAVWPTGDQLVLQTGNELRVVDLNTSQTTGKQLPDLATGNTDLYMAGNDIYISYINSGNVNILKLTDLEFQWQRRQSGNPSYRNAQIEEGVNGPVLVIERGGETFFETFDTDGLLLQAYRISDPGFASVVGDFDVDENYNWLYTGSDASGTDDYTARLKPNSRCVESFGLDAQSTDSPVEDMSFPDFMPLNLSIESISPSTYDNFPPEDYLCRTNIDSLSEIFQDTEVGCDTALVIDHGLSDDYMIDGRPLPDPLVLTESGIYSVSIERCNMEERVNFNVDFEDCYCQWYFPNTFTPNGDEINDDFLPEGECLHTQYSMQIYDRWGNLVFETQNPFVGWEGQFSGKEARPGVYTYFVQYTPIPSNEVQTITGSITLLR